MAGELQDTKERRTPLAKGPDALPKGDAPMKAISGNSTRRQYTRVYREMLTIETKFGTEELPFDPEQITVTLVRVGRESARMTDGSLRFRLLKRYETADGHPVFYSSHWRES